MRVTTEMNMGSNVSDQDGATIQQAMNLNLYVEIAEATKEELEKVRVLAEQTYYKLRADLQDINLEPNKD